MLFLFQSSNNVIFNIIYKDNSIIAVRLQIILSFQTLFTMKKLVLLFLSIILVGSFTGCSEQFLDQQPIGTFANSILADANGIPLLTQNPGY